MGAASFPEFAESVEQIVIARLVEFVAPEALELLAEDIASHIFGAYAQSQVYIPGNFAILRRKRHRDIVAAYDGSKGCARRLAQEHRIHEITVYKILAKAKRAASHH